MSIRRGPRRQAVRPVTLASRIPSFMARPKVTRPPRIAAKQPRDPRSKPHSDHLPTLTAPGASKIHGRRPDHGPGWPSSYVYHDPAGPPVARKTRLYPGCPKATMTAQRRMATDEIVHVAGCATSAMTDPILTSSIPINRTVKPRTSMCAAGRARTAIRPGRARNGQNHAAATATKSEKRTCTTIARIFFYPGGLRTFAVSRGVGGLPIAARRFPTKPIKRRRGDSFRHS
jgi:hypothetical protein